MKRLLIILIFVLPLCLLSCAAPSGGTSDTSGTPATDTDAPGDETTAAETTAADTEPETPEEGNSLYKYYENDFKIGVALPDSVFSSFKKYSDVILDNFNSFTCENEMKPDYILDRAATIADVEGNYTSPKVKFDAPSKAVKKAVESGVGMRLHTLVWHAQTPAWFFTEDYTDNGALVSREVMLQRMESYIKQVLEYYNENYPGLVYAVDVVNEAFDVGDGDANGIRQKNNKWYDTIGPDYVYWAFYYARQYAPEGVSLFYNDYACMWKIDLILNNLKKVKDEGLIDGIGMQSHLSITDSVSSFVNAIKRFAEAGYEIQLTELDVGMKEATEENFGKQEKFYRSLMKQVQKLRRDGTNITSVTVWGLSDELTWRRGESPLLLNADLSPKPAYYGFLQSDNK